MSVKALEREYMQVVAQYQEMKKDLVDIEQEMSEGLVAPEFVDNLRKQIEPIKQNYEWWSYIMFILHEPQRKAKKEKYRKTILNKAKQLDIANSPESRLAAGQDCLDKLKEMK